MWIPGQTSYAEILRGQSRSSSEKEILPQKDILLKRTHEEAPSVEIALEEVSNEPAFKEIPTSMSEDHLDVPSQPTVDFEDVQETRFGLTPETHEWDHYTQNAFGQSHFGTNGVQQNYYTQHVQPNVMDYIQPLPDMVNFIASGQQLMSSGLGTYHSSPQYPVIEEQVPLEYVGTEYNQTLSAEILEVVPKTVKPSDEELVLEPPTQTTNTVATGSHFSYAKILSQGLGTKSLQPSSLATVQPPNARPALRQKSPVHGRSMLKEDAESHSREHDTRKIMKDDSHQERIPDVVPRQHKKTYERSRHIDIERVQLPSSHGEPTTVGGYEADGLSSTQDLKYFSDRDASPYTDKSVKKRKFKKRAEEPTEEYSAGQKSSYPKDAESNNSSHTKRITIVKTKTTTTIKPDEEKGKDKVKKQIVGKIDDKNVTHREPKEKLKGESGVSAWIPTTTEMAISHARTIDQDDIENSDSSAVDINVLSNEKERTSDTHKEKKKTKKKSKKPKSDKITPAFVIEEVIRHIPDEEDHKDTPDFRVPKPVKKSKKRKGSSEKENTISLIHEEKMSQPAEEVIASDEMITVKTISNESFDNKNGVTAFIESEISDQSVTENIAVTAESKVKSTTSIIENQTEDALDLVMTDSTEEINTRFEIKSAVDVTSVIDEEKTESQLIPVKPSGQEAEINEPNLKSNENLEKQADKKSRKKKSKKKQSVKNEGDEIEVKETKINVEDKLTTTETKNLYEIDIEKQVMDDNAVEEPKKSKKKKHKKKTQNNEKNLLEVVPDEENTENIGEKTIESTVGSIISEQIALDDTTTTAEILDIKEDQKLKEYVRSETSENIIDNREIILSGPQPDDPCSPTKKNATIDVIKTSSDIKEDQEPTDIIKTPINSKSTATNEIITVTTQISELKNDVNIDRKLIDDIISENEIAKDRVVELAEVKVNVDSTLEDVDMISDISETSAPKDVVIESEMKVDLNDQETISSNIQPNVSEFSVINETAVEIWDVQKVVNEKCFKECLETISSIAKPDIPENSVVTDISHIEDDTLRNQITIESTLPADTSEKIIEKSNSVIETELEVDVDSIVEETTLESIAQTAPSESFSSEDTSVNTSVSTSQNEIVNTDHRIEQVKNIITSVMNTTKNEDITISGNEQSPDFSSIQPTSQQSSKSSEDISENQVRLAGDSLRNKPNSSISATKTNKVILITHEEFRMKPIVSLKMEFFETPVEQIHYIDKGRTEEMNMNSTETEIVGKQVGQSTEEGNLSNDIEKEKIEYLEKIENNSKSVKEIKTVNEMDTEKKSESVATEFIELNPTTVSTEFEETEFEIGTKEETDKSNLLVESKYVEFDAPDEKIKENKVNISESFIKHERTSISSEEETWTILDSNVDEKEDTEDDVEKNKNASDSFDFIEMEQVIFGSVKERPKKIVTEIYRSKEIEELPEIITNEESKPGLDKLETEKKCQGMPLSISFESEQPLKDDHISDFDIECQKTSVSRSDSVIDTEIKTIEDVMNILESKKSREITSVTITKTESVDDDLYIMNEEDVSNDEKEDHKPELDPKGLPIDEKLDVIDDHIVISDEELVENNIEPVRSIPVADFGTKSWVEFVEGSDSTDTISQATQERLNKTQDSASTTISKKDTSEGQEITEVVDILSQLKQETLSKYKPDLASIPDTQPKHLPAWLNLPTVIRDYPENDTTDKKNKVIEEIISETQIISPAVETPIRKTSETFIEEEKRHSKSDIVGNIKVVAEQIEPTEESVPKETKQNDFDNNKQEVKENIQTIVARPLSPEKPLPEISYLEATEPVMKPVSSFQDIEEEESVEDMLIKLKEETLKKYREQTNSKDYQENKSVVHESEKKTQNNDSHQTKAEKPKKGKKKNKKRKSVSFEETPQIINIEEHVQVPPDVSEDDTETAEEFIFIQGTNRNQEEVLEPISEVIPQSEMLDSTIISENTTESEDGSQWVKVNSVEEKEETKSKATVYEGLPIDNSMNIFEILDSAIIISDDEESTENKAELSTFSQDFPEIDSKSTVPSIMIGPVSVDQTVENSDTIEMSTSEFINAEKYAIIEEYQKTESDNSNEIASEEPRLLTELSREIPTESLSFVISPCTNDTNESLANSTEVIQEVAEGKKEEPMKDTEETRRKKKKSKKKKEPTFDSKNDEDVKDLSEKVNEQITRIESEQPLSKSWAEIVAKNTEGRDNNLNTTEVKSDLVKESEEDVSQVQVPVDKKYKRTELSEEFLSEERKYTSIEKQHKEVVEATSPKPNNQQRAEAEVSIEIVEDLNKTCDEIQFPSEVRNLPTSWAEVVSKSSSVEEKYPSQDQYSTFVETKTKSNIPADTGEQGKKEDEEKHHSESHEEAVIEDSENTSLTDAVDELSENINIEKLSSGKENKEFSWAKIVGTSSCLEKNLPFESDERENLSEHSDEVDHTQPEIDVGGKLISKSEQTDHLSQKETMVDTTELDRESKENANTDITKPKKKKHKRKHHHEKQMDSNIENIESSSVSEKIEQTTEIKQYVEDESVKLCVSENKDSVGSISLVKTFDHVTETEHKKPKIISISSSPELEQIDHPQKEHTPIGENIKDGDEVCVVDTTKSTKKKHKKKQHRANQIDSQIDKVDNISYIHTTETEELVTEIETEKYVEQKTESLSEDGDTSVATCEMRKDNNEVTDTDTTIRTKKKHKKKHNREHELQSQIEKFEITENYSVSKTLEQVTEISAEKCFDTENKDSTWAQIVGKSPPDEKRLSEIKESEEKVENAPTTVETEGLNDEIVVVDSIKPTKKKHKKKHHRENQSEPSIEPKDNIETKTEEFSNVATESETQNKDFTWAEIVGKSTSPEGRHQIEEDQILPQPKEETVVTPAEITEIDITKHSKKKQEKKHHQETQNEGPTERIGQVVGIDEDKIVKSPSPNKDSCFHFIEVERGVLPSRQTFDDFYDKGQTKSKLKSKKHAEPESADDQVLSDLNTTEVNQEIRENEDTKTDKKQKKKKHKKKKSQEETADDKVSETVEYLNENVFVDTTEKSNINITLEISADIPKEERLEVEKECIETEGRQVVNENETKSSKKKKHKKKPMKETKKDVLLSPEEVDRHELVSEESNLKTHDIVETTEKDSIKLYESVTQSSKSWADVVNSNLTQTPAAKTIEETVKEEIVNLPCDIITNETENDTEVKKSKKKKHKKKHEPVDEEKKLAFEITEQIRHISELSISRPNKIDKEKQTSEKELDEAEAVDTVSENVVIDKTETESINTKFIVEEQSNTFEPIELVQMRSIEDEPKSCIDIDRQTEADIQEMISKVIESEGSTSISIETEISEPTKQIFDKQVIPAPIVEGGVSTRVEYKGLPIDKSTYLVVDEPKTLLDVSDQTDEDKIINEKIVTEPLTIEHTVTIVDYEYSKENLKESPESISPEKIKIEYKGLPVDKNTEMFLDILDEPIEFSDDEEQQTLERKESFDVSNEKHLFTESKESTFILPTTEQSENMKFISEEQISSEREPKVKVEYKGLPIDKSTEMFLDILDEPLEFSDDEEQQVVESKEIENISDEKELLADIKESSVISSKTEPVENTKDLSEETINPQKEYTVEVDSQVKLTEISIRPKEIQKKDEVELFSSEELEVLNTSVEPADKDTQFENTKDSEDEKDLKKNLEKPSDNITQEKSKEYKGLPVDKSTEMFLDILDEPIEFSDDEEQRTSERKESLDISNQKHQFTESKESTFILPITVQPESMKFILEEQISSEKEHEVKVEYKGLPVDKSTEMFLDILDEPIEFSDDEEHQVVESKKIENISDEKGLLPDITESSVILSITEPAEKRRDLSEVTIIPQKGNTGEVDTQVQLSKISIRPEEIYEKEENDSFSPEQLNVLNISVEPANEDTTFETKKDSEDDKDSKTNLEKYSDNTAQEKSKVEYKGLPVDKSTEMFLGILDEPIEFSDDEEQQVVESKEVENIPDKSNVLADDIESKLISPITEPDESTKVLLEETISPEKKSKVEYKGLPVDKSTEMFLDILDTPIEFSDDEEQQDVESKKISKISDENVSSANIEETTHNLPVVETSESAKLIFKEKISSEKESEIEYEVLPIDKSTEMFLNILDEPLKISDEEQEVANIEYIDVSEERESIVETEDSSFVLSATEISDSTIIISEENVSREMEPTEKVEYKGLPIDKSTEEFTEEINDPPTPLSTEFPLLLPTSKVNDSMEMISPENELIGIINESAKEDSEQGEQKTEKHVSELNADDIPKYDIVGLRQAEDDYFINTPKSKEAPMPKNTHGDIPKCDILEMSVQDREYFEIKSETLVEEEQSPKYDVVQFVQSEIEFYEKQSLVEKLEKYDSDILKYSETQTSSTGISSDSETKECIASKTNSSNLDLSNENAEKEIDIDNENKHSNEKIVEDLQITEQVTNLNVLRLEENIESISETSTLSNIENKHHDNEILKYDTIGLRQAEDAYFINISKLKEPLDSFSIMKTEEFPEENIFKYDILQILKQEAEWYEQMIPSEKLQEAETHIFESDVPTTDVSSELKTTIDVTQSSENLELDLLPRSVDDEYEIIPSNEQYAEEISPNQSEYTIRESYSKEFIIQKTEESDSISLTSKPVEKYSDSVDDKNLDIPMSHSLEEHFTSRVISDPQTTIGFISQEINEIEDDKMCIVEEVTEDETEAMKIETDVAKDTEEKGIDEAVEQETSEICQVETESGDLTENTHIISERKDNKISDSVKEYSTPRSIHDQQITAGFIHQEISNIEVDGMSAVEELRESIDETPSKITEDVTEQSSEIREQEAGGDDEDMKIEEQVVKHFEEEIVESEYQETHEICNVETENDDLNKTAHIISKQKSCDQEKSSGTETYFDNENSKVSEALGEYSPFRSVRDNQTITDFISHEISDIGVHEVATVGNLEVSTDVQEHHRGNDGKQMNIEIDIDENFEEKEIDRSKRQKADETCLGETGSGDVTEESHTISERKPHDEIKTSEFEAYVDTAPEFVPKFESEYETLSELSTEATEFVPKSEYSRLNPNAAEFIPGAGDRSLPSPYVEYSEGYHTPQEHYQDTAPWEYTKPSYGDDTSPEQYDSEIEIPSDHASNLWVDEILHEPADDFIISTAEQTAAQIAETKAEEIAQKQLEESLLPKDVVSELSNSGVQDSASICWEEERENEVTGAGEETYKNKEIENKDPEIPVSSLTSHEISESESMSHQLVTEERTAVQEEKQVNVWEALRSGDKTYADIVASNLREKVKLEIISQPLPKQELKPNIEVKVTESVNVEPSTVEVDNEWQVKRKGKKSHSRSRSDLSEIPQPSDIAKTEEIRVDSHGINKRKSRKRDKTPHEISRVDAEPAEVQHQSPNETESSMDKSTEFNTSDAVSIEIEGKSISEKHESTLSEQIQSKSTKEIQSESLVVEDKSEKRKRSKSKKKDKKSTMVPQDSSKVSVLSDKPIITDHLPSDLDTVKPSIVTIQEKTLHFTYADIARSGRSRESSPHIEVIKPIIEKIKSKVVIEKSVSEKDYPSEDTTEKVEDKIFNSESKYNEPTETLEQDKDSSREPERGELRSVESTSIERNDRRETISKAPDSENFINEEVKATISESEVNLKSYADILVENQRKVTRNDLSPQKSKPSTPSKSVDVQIIVVGEDKPEYVAEVDSEGFIPFARHRDRSRSRSRSERHKKPEKKENLKEFTNVTDVVEETKHTAVTTDVEKETIVSSPVKSWASIVKANSEEPKLSKKQVHAIDIPLSYTEAAEGPIENLDTENITQDVDETTEVDNKQENTSGFFGNLIASVKKSVRGKKDINEPTLETPIEKKKKHKSKKNKNQYMESQPTESEPKVDSEKDASELSEKTILRIPESIHQEKISTVDMSSAEKKTETVKEEPVSKDQSFIGNILSKVSPTKRSKKDKKSKRVVKIPDDSNEELSKDESIEPKVSPIEKLESTEKSPEKIIDKMQYEKEIELSEKIITTIKNESTQGNLNEYIPSDGVEDDSQTHEKESLKLNENTKEHFIEENIEIVNAGIEEKFVEMRPEKLFEPISDLVTYKDVLDKDQFERTKTLVSREIKNATDEFLSETRRIEETLRQDTIESKLSQITQDEQISESKNEEVVENIVEELKQEGEIELVGQEDFSLTVQNKTEEFTPKEETQLFKEVSVTDEEVVDDELIARSGNVLFDDGKNLRSGYKIATQEFLSESRETELLTRPDIVDEVSVRKKKDKKRKDSQGESDKKKPGLIKSIVTSIVDKFSGKKSKKSDSSQVEDLARNIDLDGSYWITKCLYDEAEESWYSYSPRQDIVIEDSTIEPDTEDDSIAFANNLALDGSFWITKSIYDQAEELWQIEKALANKLQAAGDSRKSSEEPPDGDSDSDGSSGRGSPDNKPDGESSETSMPSSQYMMYSLPGGIAGWREESTYLAPEPLSSESSRYSTIADSGICTVKSVDEHLSAAKRLSESMAEDVISEESPSQLTPDLVSSLGPQMQPPTGPEISTPDAAERLKKVKYNCVICLGFQSLCLSSVNIVLIVIFHVFWALILFSYLV
nr:uncharacterized protein LOC111506041 [Leptinotarsa decemlineata]